MDSKLLSEFARRLAESMPTTPDAGIESMARALVEVGAFDLRHGRLVPVGDRIAMTRARLIAPALCQRLANEHVAHASSASSPEAAPFDRARARLQTMGVDPDRAFDEGDDETSRVFMGVNLASIQPKGAA